MIKNVGPGVIPSFGSVLRSSRQARLYLMEDSMDMDMSPLKPQNYLFGCELKADKDYHFKVDNDENEHQLSLRMISLGAGAKDELHIVEAEAMHYEGSPIKVTLATLKMSVQPTVSLGGFEITPPVVLRLRCGSGPVHISGQHPVAVEEDAESEEEDEEDDKLLSKQDIAIAHVEETMSRAQKWYETHPSLDIVLLGSEFHPSLTLISESEPPHAHSEKQLNAFCYLVLILSRVIRSFQFNTIKQIFSREYRFSMKDPLGMLLHAPCPSVFPACAGAGYSLWSRREEQLAGTEQGRARVRLGAGECSAGGA
ncbi:hypothetical protein NN561_014050 [Cricetulus griseus]